MNLDWLKAYQNPRIWVVALMGFSSGLPRVMVGGTLALWLADFNLTIASVALFSYVALPYTFKFLWAPLLDQLRIPLIGNRLGRRVSWMVVCQLAILLLLLLMGSLDPSAAPLLTAALAVAIAFFSATQDIAIDAYRTEYLDPEQYGEGVPMSVFGYRVGMLVAGAGALYIADFLGWQLSYMAMAACMLVGLSTALIAGEPERSRAAMAKQDAEHTPHQPWGELLREKITAPFADFMRRYPEWIMLLIFIVSYRLPDGFIGFVTNPFFMEVGFSKSEIASVVKLFGFGATIAGMVAGAALMRRYTLYQCLIGFGLFQILANLTYLSLALQGKQMEWLVASVTMDNLSGGMVTAAGVAFIMRLCQSAEHTATHFALLSAVATAGATLLSGPAGAMVEAFGWPVLFGFSALLGIPSMFLLLTRRTRFQQLAAA